METGCTRTISIFHNFNLRIFNLRVSNPNELIVDVVLTRFRISICQGLGPTKHDEISEIDRTASRPEAVGDDVEDADQSNAVYDIACAVNNVAEPHV